MKYNKRTNRYHEKLFNEEEERILKNVMVGAMERKRAGPDGENKEPRFENVKVTIGIQESMDFENMTFETNFKMSEFQRGYLSALIQLVSAGEISNTTANQYAPVHMGPGELIIIGYDSDGKDGGEIE